MVANVSGIGEGRVIVYVGGFRLPDGNAAAQRVVANARILRELGYRVILVGSSPGVSAEAGVERLADTGLPFECLSRRYPASVGEWARHLVRVDAVADAVAGVPVGQLAAIICYDVPTLAQWRLKRLAHRRGAKALTEVVEWFSASRPRSVAAVVKNIERPLLRRHNRGMDGIIVASEFLKAHYQSTGRPILELPTLMSERVTDKPAFDPRDPGRPKRLFFAGTGIDPAIVRDVTAGPKDRLDKVVEVLDVAKRRGARFKMDVFGVEKAAYLAVFPLHAPLLDSLGDDLVFHGWRQRREVLANLREADFSIFLREDTVVTRAGFPTKYAESINFGTPVITNAVGSIVSHHREGETGFYIDYHDSEAAGRRLAEILERPLESISPMNRVCLDSARFHYQSYIEPTREFMRQMGVTP